MTKGIKKGLIEFCPYCKKDGISVALLESRLDREFDTIERGLVCDRCQRSFTQFWMATEYADYGEKANSDSVAQYDEKYRQIGKNGSV